MERETKKVKMGASASKIVGIVFASVGGMFFLLGLIFGGVARKLADGLGILSMAGGMGNSFSVLAWVFSLLGIILLAVGICCVSMEGKKKKICSRLLADGYYIIGEVVEVERNLAVSYGSTGHPYVIKCKYEDANGTTHIFKSRNIRRYPGVHLEGTPVKIYVDRNQPDQYKDYYMDIDEVLGNVIEH